MVRRAADAHPMVWTFHLDDDLRRELSSAVPVPETRRIVFPPGAGPRRMVTDAAQAR